MTTPGITIFLLFRWLQAEEGYREHVYTDTEGYPTIGFGHRVIPDDVIQSPVSRANAERMLRSDCTKTITEAHRYFGKALSCVSGWRRLALLAMAFQIGARGVSKFRLMLTAIEHKDWTTASAEALDSLWAKQTPKRAKRTADCILTGTPPPNIPGIGYARTPPTK